MKIACLGWGSLIWRPETLKIQEIWFKDGPILPIEFTRQSKDGRMTLIIDRNAMPIRVLWALMNVENLEEAVASLTERECTNEMNIHSVKSSETTEDSIKSVVLEWLKNKQLDAAIWTGLSFSSGTNNVRPSIDGVINYLKGLQHNIQKHAEEYVRKAPKQIDTEYRRRIETELGWHYIGSATNSVDMSEKKESKGNNQLMNTLLSVLVGGILTLFINLTITFMANNQKDKEQLIEQRKSLLSRRMELIDKTTKVLYQLPGVNEMFSHELYRNIDTAVININNGLIDLVPKSFAVSKELAQLRGEFFSTLVQDRLYFGKHTSIYMDSMFAMNATHKLSWWQTPDSSYKRLVEVMVSELYVFN